MKQIYPEHADTNRELWPSSDYLRQVDLLKKAIGQRVFLVEFKQGSINLGIQFSNKAFELLDIIDFPKPDPIKGIAPHIIILSDGRGVNLGRIARITINRPFSSSASDILYRDSLLMDEFLLQKRHLSKESIAACSKSLLREFLGKPLSSDIEKRSLSS